MNPVEYVFSIDVFTPDTLPMGRLAEYLAALAKLIGHADHTHFVAVEPGSAKLRTAVEAVDAPKVEARLKSVRVGEAPKEAMAGKQALEDLLANDNAVATLVDCSTGLTVLPFIGRDRPKPLTFPPFRENTTIDGQVVSIGGRDATAHATLQDGDTVHVGISMKREVARDLAKLLYGPSVRLHGNGRFERQANGVWKMLDFKVDRFDLLDGRPIAEVLETIRAVPGNAIMIEGRADAKGLRFEGDEDQ